MKEEVKELGNRQDREERQGQWELQLLLNTWGQTALFKNLLLFHSDAQGDKKKSTPKNEQHLYEKNNFIVQSSKFAFPFIVFQQEMNVFVRIVMTNHFPNNGCTCKPAVIAGHTLVTK